MIATSERVSTTSWQRYTTINNCLTELSAFGNLAFFVCLPLGDSASKMVMVCGYRTATNLVVNAECSITDTADNQAGRITLLHHLEQ